MPKPRMKSYKTVELKLTAEHYKEFPSLTKNTGGWQGPYQHMTVNPVPGSDGLHVARVRMDDLPKLKEFALNANSPSAKGGRWEKAALEILELNEIDPNS